VTQDQPAPAELLQRVADTLNDCEQHGHLVQVAHGAIITTTGYVLAYGPEGQRWTVRERTPPPKP
jgi:broad specificity phosphatase PhoE